MAKTIAFLLNLLPPHQIASATVFMLVPLLLSGQLLTRSSEVSYYLLELKAISAGEIDEYLANRLDHEWRLRMPWDRNGLLTSRRGDEQWRKERLKFFPALTATGYLNGGHVNRAGAYIDIAPLITVLARYKFPPTGRYGLLFWTRFEKHSVVSQEEIKDLTYDLNWEKEQGRKAYPGNDSSWVEYDIGDGGVLLTYPSGVVTLVKSNPIWGPGYTGQLMFSGKAPSFVFLNIRHRFGKRWQFSFIHGSLNSTFPDTSHTHLYPMGGLPLVRKYVAAHRLDILLRKNVRLGLGESVIYGARGIEGTYLLPFLFYWSSQHDLSDSDNLQMFLDVEIIKKNVGRLYGAFYVDEWDFLDTFNSDESRNWMAYQLGLSYDPPLLSDWHTLVRLEVTHLSPYVYVHRSSINTFEHWAHALGFWSGPNSDNLFMSVECSPGEGQWFQLYVQRTRRGEVNDSTIRRQYTHQHVPFLYHTYDGNPEQRILVGLRGEITISSNLRLAFDLFRDNWSQWLDPTTNNRGRSRKFDGSFQLSVGL